MTDVARTADAQTFPEFRLQFGTWTAWLVTPTGLATQVGMSYPTLEEAIRATVHPYGGAIALRMRLV